MRRWIKNLGLLTSLVWAISCGTPHPPAASSTSSPLTVPLEASATSVVEVRNAFGDILEVFDAPNLSISELRARTAAVKVSSLLQKGHGSGTYMIAYGRRVVVVLQLTLCAVRQRWLSRVATGKQSSAALFS